MNTNNRRRNRNPINNRFRRRNNRRNNNRGRNRGNLNRNLPFNNNVSRVRTRITNNRRIKRRNTNRYNKNYENKLQKEVNKLTNKLDSMSIKSTNLIVPKKEIRTDRLISPYNMARRAQYIPIYEIKEKVLNMSVYTKLVVSLEGNTDEINYYMLFFPYSINFKMNLYDNYSNKIIVSTGTADVYKNIWFLADNSTQQGFTVNYKETAPSGIIGNWKLIGTTIKIYNVANMLNKGGDFSIIKIQSNELMPYFVNHTAEPEIGQLNVVRALLTKDYSQAPRNNFSANDTAFIDEYNVSEGTNIFNSPIEYMGCKYSSTNNYRQATYGNDMVGNNVTYMFHTKGMGTPQTYVFEVWNVFSIIPAPEAGLGNLGTITKRCFTKEVVENIKTRPNMYKANK